MGTELAKAYVQIIPSAAGIKGKITQELGGESESAGRSSGGKITSAIKNAIVSAGIGATLGKALTEGANLQQSIGGIETLFKSSSDKVVEYAKNAYKTAGMSANKYMEIVTSFSASLLQGLGGDTEKAADTADMALRDMSDNANKMGTSMELIQNAYQGFAKQNYTMLDNLKLGYGGTKTEMQRLLEDAQKLTGVKYDISNLNDVYSAIHAVQEEMGITGTTAAEAEKTFSGSLASMKATASNVLANLTLGEDINPSLYALSETVFTFVSGNLLPMVGNLLSALPEVVDGAFNMAIRGMNLAADNMDTLVQNGAEMVIGLVTGIISNLPYLAESAIKIVASLGTALINTDWAEIANNFITTLKDNLNVAAGEIFGVDTGIITAVGTSITNNLPFILEKGIEIVSNIANGILQNIPTVMSSIGAVASELLGYLLDMLPELLESGIELIGELAQGMFNNLPAILESIAEILSELLAKIAESLPELLQKGIELIGELAAGIIEAIPDAVAAIPEVITGIVDAFGEYDWLSIGADIISGLAEGILGGVGKIAEAATSAAEEAFNAAKDFLDINSPSGEFEWIGEQSDLGLVKGLRGNAGLISSTMKDITDSMLGTYDAQRLGLLADYNTLRSTNAEHDTTVGIAESLGMIIYLLELLTKQELKVVIKDREVLRFLRELGVVLA